MEDIARNVIEENRKKIGKSLKKGNIIFMDFEDVSSVSPDFADFLLSKPYEGIYFLENAVKEVFVIADKVTWRFTSLPSCNHTKIREIRSRNLGSLIKLTGIVKKASVVRPREVLVRFSCPQCGTIININQGEKKLTKPARCSCGHKGSFKILSKDLIDLQHLVIEENTEDCQSMQPQKLKATLATDLVEPKIHAKTRPGSRVELIGILKEVRQTNSQGTELVDYDIVLDTNNIIHLDDYEEDLEISEEDLKLIQDIASNESPIEVIKESIAPSIFGHSEIKKALALQLFKGVPKKRSDGTRIRGDLHCLLVGDPGVAKSVMLNFMNGVAPNSRMVSGKSTSAAGLIAGVSKDESGWSLEAGAMVLSNKGQLVIDEFEKMNEEDRSSMHQALEQQFINVSKVSIQATLPTETTVLAAANPKYGKFMEGMDLAKQINMVPTLLSRFDFIFVLRDKADEVKDLMIANKILDEHKGDLDVIDNVLLKKYILYANKNYKPVMTNPAKKEILDFYVKMRKINGEAEKSTISITPRQLEAIIRMCEANAKMRLSNRITLKDVKVSCDIMLNYLKDMGYDEGTNKYDINKLSGNSTSKANQMQALLKCMINLKQEGHRLDVGYVYEVSGMKSFEDFEALIEKLVVEGYVVRPEKDRLFLL
jgi:replicative DNA helicase Mcm